MTNKDIFEVVEDVKKALERGEFLYYESGCISDLSQFKIVHICIGGEICVQDIKTDNRVWTHYDHIVSKGDLDIKKRKELEEKRQRNIKHCIETIDYYQQKLGQLQKGVGDD